MVKNYLTGVLSALVFLAAALPAVAFESTKPAPIEVAANEISGINSDMKKSLAGVRLGKGVTMRKKNEAAEPDAGHKVIRNPQFLYRFYRTENPSGKTVVLLHGSGGDEASLVPLASKIWPNAVLLGVRGRVLQEGRTRWYRSITPVKFDQKDVRAEANAFVGFLTRLANSHDLDLSRATFVGYSNGANLLAATMLLHPDLVKRAVLMRPMPVLDETPAANLKANVLTVAGAQDELYAPYAPALSAILRSNGARVDARTVETGHLLGDEDVRIVSRWLAGQAPDGAPAVSMQTE
ncbi:carboxylesterase [Phyllobacterium phragmitis]|uniref:Carboxylesterase n=1 Tax=Phyllobacterium phragmitis TaxID=2670329 RepID=A0A2S9IRV8_9HYPH|nr:alpha/beta hydrolase [Phyllobacterium phragmitis]PRD43262.1 carboxylesterase [Phyllobacterium phragmitis]